MTIYPIPPLFNQNTPTAQLSRHTDPETSQRAARLVTRSGKAVRQRRLLYAAVVAGPGRTAAELGKACGIGTFDACRRLPDMKVQRPEVDGRIPVIIATREGLQEGAAQWALVNNRPRLASRSMFGVYTPLRPPRQLVQSFRSSTEMNKTFGCCFAVLHPVKADSTAISASVFLNLTFR